MRRSSEKLTAATGGKCAAIPQVGRARPVAAVGRYRFIVVTYQDAADQWRWRLKSRRNGKIVGDSAEGYARRAHCRRMVMAIFGRSFDVEILP